MREVVSELNYYIGKVEFRSIVTLKKSFYGKINIPM